MPSRLAALRRAATLYVANNGLDTNGCTAADSPCRTISHAIALAVAGDTVLVGPGRYGDLNLNGSYDGINEEAGMLIPGGGAA